MFERQPKIVTLDTISELCKPSSRKVSKEKVKIVETTVAANIPMEVKEDSIDKSEEIILWL